MILIKDFLKINQKEVKKHLNLKHKKSNPNSQEQHIRKDQRMLMKD